MKKKIKRIIRVTDAKLFGGRIYNFYMLYKDNKRKNFFKKRKSVVVCEPVSDMILMQYNKNEYMQYQFYDLAVRYLAIGEYYGNNDFGFALYRKMHMLGGNYGQTNFSEDYYKKMQKQKKTAEYGLIKEEHSIEQFRKLIQSYEENGYDESSIVMADVNLLSMNGSHRTALAVYRNQEFINVEVHDRQFTRRYTLDWFWQSGFTREEIDIIENTAKNIIDDCKRKLGDFYCILYPPAYEYFDEIVGDIDNFDHGNIRVIDWQDMMLEKGDFTGLIRAIYSFDSILPRNFERKLFYILKSSRYIDGKLPIRLVKISINNPVYRLKTDNGLPESINTVRLKEAIRGRYKVRDEKFTRHYVGDYAHDVIIHSTDNYLSNKAIRLLLSIDRDISGLFELLNRYDYAVVESGTDKTSPEFPRSFYLNDDIDLFVKDSDLEEISNVIEKFCKEKYCGEWLNIETIKSNNGKRVRVLLKDCLIIMFDLMVKMPGLKKDFIEKAIHRCYESNYKHLSSSDEITARISKYVAAPSKSWHAEYIKAHKNEYTFDVEAFEEPEKVKKIFENI